MVSKKIPVGTIVIFVFFLATMIAAYYITKPAPPPQELAGVLRPHFKSLESFELRDHNNAVFDNQRFSGKWSFVFFGFTSCAYVCPTTLNVLSSVYDSLVKDGGHIAEDTQVVFISVDPDRDSVEKIAAYITKFNKDFIGVTANKNKIDKIARQFGSGYVMDPKADDGKYDVAHTSAIFLVDPFGRLVASFSQPHLPSTITSQYKKIRKYFSWD